MFFNFIPIVCNRLIVRRRWLRAALRFRCCVNVNCATIDSARFREQRPPRNQIGQSRAAAVRTWHTVKSGFFPPMLQAKFAQEHMAQTTEEQMALNRTEFTDLKMIHDNSVLLSSKARSIVHRVKATLNSISVEVPSGALLIKYLTSL